MISHNFMATITPTTIARETSKKTDYPHGPDFGRWTNWGMPSSSPKPIDFVIMGVTSGNYVLPRALENEQRFIKAPRRQTYHFYEAPINWTKQVDKFLLASERMGAKALWWDYESNNNNIFNKRTALETMEAIKWLKARFAGPVGIYSNLSDYLYYLKPWVGKFMEGVDWWCAYPDRPITTSEYITMMTRINRGYVMLQYSWRGVAKDYGVLNYPGNNVYEATKASIDLNVFVGGDIDTWLGLEKPAKPRRFPLWKIPRRPR